MTLVPETGKAAMRERMAKRYSRLRSQRATKKKMPAPFIQARRYFAAYGFDKNQYGAKYGGKQLYFTGKHCRRGHYAPRYTYSRACTACAGLRAFPIFQLKTASS